MKKRIEAFRARLRDADRSHQERVFLMMTIIAVIAVLLAFLGDIITGENPVEIAALSVALITTPLVAFVSFKMNQLNIGAMIISLAITFGILPIVFFYGGGLTGAAILWFSFSYLYIGLIMTGVLRMVMLALLTLQVIAIYLLGYFHPSLIVLHDRRMWYVDTAISVIITGLIIYCMVWFQNRIFQDENRRTREQAKEIEELNRSQNRFFSTMSHEIRTPINTIIGLNEMILREDPTEEVAQDARSIQSASKTLLALINDVLDMSRMESGQMEIVHAPYDVGRMLSDIVNMVWIRAKEKGLQFAVNVDPALPSQLYSDEVRIKQILINLLNNAVKYTREGSVLLTILSGEKKDGRVVVTYSVEDTGMGIRQESIPHLFDAFRREDEEKNHYIEGTGLGLSIVKQLVDLMGGEISVSSVYTKGSTFVVTLEQEIADATEIGKIDAQTIRLNGERKYYIRKFEAPEARILIVDDNEANRMVTSRLLADTRVQIDMADSGEAALNCTAAKHYHAILMDHLMPGMDGIECLHAIREQAGGLDKETPVIALTANAGSESAALYRREGFDGYLVKPVDPTELEEMLLSVLPEDLALTETALLHEEDGEQIVRESRHKVPILITTDSICDLPHSLLAAKRIPVLSYSVHTSNGVFMDGLEANGDTILRYLKDKSSGTTSEAPRVSEYEAFFADQLSRAQHILHITTAKASSLGYANASQAAKAFYNVRVLDSGQLSSGLGMLTLSARELADVVDPDVDLIMQSAEKRKGRIHTSFIVDDTEYLHRSGRIPEWAYRLCSALMAHPVMVMKNGKMQVWRIMFGGPYTARESYIKKILRRYSDIDLSMLFITYVGMSREEIELIKNQVLALVPFENVYLQKASPSTAINCGPGTFGLIFASGTVREGMGR